MRRVLPTASMKNNSILILFICCQGPYLDSHLAGQITTCCNGSAQMLTFGTSLFSVWMQTLVLPMSFEPGHTNQIKHSQDLVGQSRSVCRTVNRVNPIIMPEAEFYFSPSWLSLSLHLDHTRCPAVLTPQYQLTGQNLAEKIYVVCCLRMSPGHHTAKTKLNF